MKELLTWAGIVAMVAILVFAALKLGWLVLPYIVIGAVIKWVIDDKLIRRIK